MLYYYMEFEGHMGGGIRIRAKSEEDAISNAENPANWRDHEKRKVCYIEVDNDGDRIYSKRL